MARNIATTIPAMITKGQRIGVELPIKDPIMSSIMMMKKIIFIHISKECYCFSRVHVADFPLSLPLRTAPEEVNLSLKLPF